MRFTHCCYYPTSTLFVDDHLGFLEGLRFAASDRFPAYFYDRPALALNFLQQSEQTSIIVEQTLHRGPEASAQLSRYDVDLSSLSKIMYNGERFHEVSVAVVDYSMPGLSGLDLFRALHLKKPLRRVLFTGDADEFIAVKAFNEHLVDRYIRKDASGLYEVLEEVIAEQQNLYFKEVTSVIEQSLELQSSYCARDPKFQEIFHEITSRQKTCEYYLLDNIGSFLLLDENGKAWIIALQTDETLDFHLDILSHETGLPESIRQSLLSKEHIPFFLTNTQNCLPPSEWGPYIHPAMKVHGDKTFYFTVIEDLKAYDLELEQVVPYKKFLNNFYRNA